MSKDVNILQSEREAVHVANNWFRKLKINGFLHFPSDLSYLVGTFSVCYHHFISKNSKQNHVPIHNGIEWTKNDTQVTISGINSAYGSFVCEKSKIKQSVYMLVFV